MNKKITERFALLVMCCFETYGLWYFSKDIPAIYAAGAFLRCMTIPFAIGIVLTIIELATGKDIKDL